MSVLVGCRQGVRVGECRVIWEGSSIGEGRERSERALEMP